MASITRTFAGLLLAPWLQVPQTQHATFTFDDATPAEYPTYDTIRAEMGRRSAFADTDATDTGDTWDGAPLGDLEPTKVDILYIFEQKEGLGSLGEAPAKLPLDYVWPGLAEPVLTSIDADTSPAAVATSDQTPAIVGTGEVGATVEFLLNGAVHDTFVVDENGDYAGDLADVGGTGTFTFNVRQRLNGYASDPIGPFVVVVS